MQHKTADQIIEYLNSHYNVENLRETYENNNAAIVGLGMTFVLLESNIEIGDNLDDIVQPEAMTSFESCLYGTLTGLLGISEINSLIKDFKSGVSATTVIGSARVMLRRVFTAFTIVVTLYEFGDCMGWY